MCLIKDHDVKTGVSSGLAQRNLTYVPLPIAASAAKSVCRRSFAELRVRIPSWQGFCLFRMLSVVIEISAAGRSIIRSSLTELGSSLCGLETSTMRWLRFGQGCCLATMKAKITMQYVRQWSVPPTRPLYLFSRRPNAFLTTLFSNVSDQVSYPY
jgi:hypothetical protein